VPVEGARVILHVEAVRVIVEALKELIKARLLLKAVRVIIEVVRVLVEAVRLIKEVVRVLVKVSKRSKKTAGWYLMTIMVTIANGRKQLPVDFGRFQKVKNDRPHFDMKHIQWVILSCKKKQCFIEYSAYI
jgi:hypothetical protein